MNIHDPDGFGDHLVKASVLVDCAGEQIEMALNHCEEDLILRKRYAGLLAMLESLSTALHNDIDVMANRKGN